MSDAAAATAARVATIIAITLAVGIVVTLFAAGVAVAVRQHAARRAADAARPALGTHAVDWRRYATDAERGALTPPWRELAAFPQPFQRDCACSEARYTLVDAAAADTGPTVLVDNRCETRPADGGEAGVQAARGVARVVPGTDGREARVLFGPDWLVERVARGAAWWTEPLFRWFGGDYWVYGVDDDYRYAIVGNPERTALWLLTRAPEGDVDARTYRALVDRALALGFDVSLLEPRCRDFSDDDADAPGADAAQRDASDDDNGAQVTP